MIPFLWTADNPHAPVRANGRRFWGYPQRQDTIRCIGVHTAETAPFGTSAEAVARWLRDAASAPASYHRIVDSDSTVLLLPDEAVAFHIRSFNSGSLGLSFATRARLWGQHPAWDEQALRRGAEVAAAWCRTYDIPVRWLTRQAALSGQRGFVRHSTMDPQRRTDPGAGFPAARFFDLIEQHMEDDMPYRDWPEADRQALLDDIWNYDNGSHTRPIISTHWANVRSRRTEDGMKQLSRKVATLAAAGGASAGAVATELGRRLLGG